MSKTYGPAGLADHPAESSLDSNELERGQEGQQNKPLFWHRFRNVIPNINAETIVNDNDIRPASTPKSASVIAYTELEVSSRDVH